MAFGATAPVHPARPRVRLHEAHHVRPWAELLQQLRLQGCVCSERYGYNDESGHNVESSTLLASSEGANDEMTSGDDTDAIIDDILGKIGGERIGLYTGGEDSGEGDIQSSMNDCNSEGDVGNVGNGYDREGGVGNDGNSFIGEGGFLDYGVSFSGAGSDEIGSSVGTDGVRLVGKNGMNIGIGMDDGGAGDCTGSSFGHAGGEEVGSSVGIDGLRMGASGMSIGSGIDGGSVGNGLGTVFDERNIHRDCMFVRNAFFVFLRALGVASAERAEDCTARGESYSEGHYDFKMSLLEGSCDEAEWAEEILAIDTHHGCAGEPPQRRLCPGSGAAELR